MIRIKHIVVLLFVAIAQCYSSSCSGFEYELIVGEMETLGAAVTQIGQSVEKLNQLIKSQDCAPSTIYASCDKVPSRISGVYSIRTNLHEVTEVYCDQEYEGGGWTVIQNRFDGAVNFYRDWSEYKRGFGSLNGGEFWLGLDVIHQLTYSAPHELVVLLEDFEGNATFAKLEQFEVGGEQTGYTLTLAEGFSGPAGDSITAHKAAKFSTFDKDNDTWGESCAITYHGAWWYTACHRSNLNGKYSKGNTTEYATGMNWYTFRGHHYALKTSKMMIRRRKAQN